MKPLRYKDIIPNARLNLGSRVLVTNNNFKPDNVLYFISNLHLEDIIHINKADKALAYGFRVTKLK